MKSQFFFILASFGCISVVFGSSFITIDFRDPSNTQAGIYSMPISTIAPLSGCDGGWTVSLTFCNFYPSRDACFVGITAMRNYLKSTTVKGTLMRADRSTIDITNSIIYLCLEDGCQYTYSRPLPTTDSVKFSGIGGQNPLWCNSEAVTITPGGVRNAVFQYSWCQNVPNWLAAFYNPGQDLTFAAHLRDGATSISVGFRNCTQFNVDPSKLTFTSA